MAPAEYPELKTESDVEQKVVMPLLSDGSMLAIPSGSIQTKEYLPPTPIDKVAGKQSGYYPDYSIWLFGLPVMIVEVKSPDVEPLVGYREACLYARHLNQKYPSDFNPCRFVAATNGHTIIAGTWDSGPTLTLLHQDLQPGSSALVS